jgi:hypothetical protein
VTNVAVGQRYDVELIPPVPEHTTYIDAGALSIGVEFRVLTDEVVDANYANDDRAKEIVDAIRPARFDTTGLSFHVMDRQSGLEYLRFDMFDDGPHYHYIKPGEYHIAVMFDPYACGDMFEWSVNCLRTHLPAMLRQAGAAKLADRVDRRGLDAAIDLIVETGRTAVASAAGQGS